MLVSHDHFDHVASAVDICKKTGAFLGGPAQTMARLTGEGFDAEKAPKVNVIALGSGETANI